MRQYFDVEVQGPLVFRNFGVLVPIAYAGVVGTCKCLLMLKMHASLIITEPRQWSISPLKRQLCKPTSVQVSAAPGTYSISAARSGPGRGKETTHVVRLEPGKSVSVTLSV